MSKIIPNLISPGVRDLVLWLNKEGYETTDSGDGTHHGEGMECAVPFPMIAIKAGKYEVRWRCDFLYEELSGRGVKFGSGPDDPRIDGNYNPVTGAGVIVLSNILSKDVDLHPAWCDIDENGEEY